MDFCEHGDELFCLLNLSNKCAIYVNYLFVVALLHVSMCIHSPQGISYYISKSYEVNKVETLIYVLIKHIVHLLDKYNKILQKCAIRTSRCYSIFTPYT